MKNQDLINKLALQVCKVIQKTDEDFEFYISGCVDNDIPENDLLIEANKDDGDFYAKVQALIHYLEDDTEL